MSNYCEDCGCKIYNGHCVNCHEETYIYEQNCQNDEPISLSNEFFNKVKEQEIEAKEIRSKQETWDREHKDENNE